MKAERDMVVSDPEILGGIPVLRGTRVPVYDVAASVSAGLPIGCILAAYPSINADMIEGAVIYAKAHPAPRRRKLKLPEGAVLISESWVPRRKKD